MDEKRHSLRVVNEDEDTAENDGSSSPAPQSAPDEKNSSPAVGESVADAVGQSSAAQPEPQENPLVLEGESVAITGTLASMTHDQAAEQIQRHGGVTTTHVSRQTTMLVIGEEGWPLESDGKPSQKLQAAQALIDDGHSLRIVPETDWLRMLELNVENPDVKRLYTPAMLSQLLDIPVHVIRTWERAGLIRAEKRIFRLPFFSYQEVTAARRVSELLQSGVKQQQLTRSLQMLKKYLPDPGRILEQLELLADHHQLVVRDQHGFLDPQTRQRYFAFTATVDADRPDGDAEDDDEIAGQVVGFPVDQSARRSATDWLVEGCRKAEVADVSAAIRCFRRALQINPQDAEAHFYLADSLYRLGKHEAALERYLAAIEHDPEYLEAWNQIGCVYAELSKFNDAIAAFDEALAIMPDFSETHLQKAETLRSMRRIDDAVVHWKAYLRNDEQGPWAELVHQRLEQAGVEFEG
ncbi:MAG: tetratricopeptide repeat protein [Rubinisphaera brasiliensis]|uniref:tetratricopeptide repeat protein n=1 Tax=Rubinisphaera brasiliensis TaxID=119 RepID=UPI003918C42C